MHETTVIIAEKDSDWLQWAKASRKPEHALVLVVQHDDETQSGFFDRMRRGFDHIRSGSTQIDRVVISGGSQWDNSKLRARADLVHHLLERSALRTTTAQALLDHKSKADSGLMVA